MLAHQGGWDEIGMVLVPIVIFAILLVVANRRADTIEGGRQREGDEPGATRPGAGQQGDGPTPR
jgi:hypothetical protein